MDTLIFNGKPIVPMSNGLSRFRKSGVVQNETVSGTKRQRKKYFDTTHNLQVSFDIESPEIMDYVLGFIDTNEGEEFTCYLSADRPIVEPYTVQAISEWVFSETTSDTSIVSCKFEVFSFKILVLNEFLSANYMVNGDEVVHSLLGLREIVNAAMKP